MIGTLKGVKKLKFSN